ncbi:MAG: hypothetical protein WAP35_06050 [Solirubrobacterales bacterium]
MNAIPINPNDHDQFFLRQKWTLGINRYFFSLTEDSAPFVFVEQKRFKFKEDIRFYSDESKTIELMRIKARQRFDPRATYDITDSNGVDIGKIQKQFGKSLLRSSYLLFDPAGAQVAVLQERSLPVAIFRRAVGFIPYVDDFANWLPIPYDFEFLRNDGELIGLNKRRRWKFTDQYDIDFSTDPGRTIDRRLVLAATVGMDALQAR